MDAGVSLNHNLIGDAHGAGHRRQRMAAVQNCSKAAFASRPWIVSERSDADPGAQQGIELRCPGPAYELSGDRGGDPGLRTHHRELELDLLPELAEGIGDQPEVL